MEYEIFHRPSYAMLNMQLSAGENVSAEAGAMVSMSSGIEIETSMRGGLYWAAYGANSWVASPSSLTRLALRRAER